MSLTAPVLQFTGRDLIMVAGGISRINVLWLIELMVVALADFYIC